jgi:transcriptional regulator with XRE-family HTH domain
MQSGEDHIPDATAAISDGKAGATTSPKATRGRRGTYENVTTNNPVDQHVGRRVRARRLALGLSQSAVAQSIGITGQQYQKYERGENRISASRLFDLATCLKTPISHFFEEMDDQTRGASPARMLSGTLAAELEPAAPLEPVPPASSYERRQTMDLLRLWQQLPDHARGRIVDLLRSMVDLSTDSSGSTTATNEPA